MNSFPCILDLRIDWSDMDMFGHVNNVAYFRYVQASRVNYWELSMPGHSFGNDSIGPILLTTSCRFISPLHYPGNVTLRASVEFIKTTSFGMCHQILNSENEICAEAHDAIVMYDYAKKEKVPIPLAFREAAERLEKCRFGQP